MQKLSTFLTLLLLFIVVGCNAPNRTPLELESARTTGFLIDSPVQGVAYSCADISGITDARGAFEFRQTCTVEFRIGNVLIGAIPGAAINDDNRVYPSDLVGVPRNTINAPLQLRILRILQGLDSDANPANGISITAKVRSDFERLELNVLDETITLQTIINAFDEVGGYTLQSEELALAHYRQTISDDLNITIVVIAPVLPSIDDQNITIFENSALFTPLATLQFDVGDNVNVNFSVNSDEFNITNQGQIVSNVALDFETKRQYVFDVNISNALGSDTARIGVSITNVPDVPFILESAAVSIDENSSIGTTVHTVVVTQSSDVNSSSYQLTGVGADDFTIDAQGVVSVANALDFETRSAYQLQVARISSIGTATAELNISVNDLPDTVAVIEDLNVTLFDNTLADTRIGSMVISALGDAALEQFRISGAGSSDFTIDTSGAIRTTTLIQANNQSLYSLNIILQSAAGDSNSATLNIRVNSVPALVTQKITVDESALFGASLAQNSSYVFVGAPEDNGTGAIYQFNNDENLSFVQRIVPNSLQSGERFGANILANETTVIISASSRDLNSSDNGQLYLYDITAQNFTTLTPQDANRTTQFGRALAFSGDLLVVSAVMERNSSDSRGVIFLYQTLSSTPVATLQSTTVNNSTFGSAVALNGSELFIGAPQDGVGGIIYYYPHDENNITTSIARELPNQSGIESAAFGATLDANSTALLVGAPGDFNNEGRIYLFRKVLTTYNYNAIYRKSSDRTSGDAFGATVRLSAAQRISRTQLDGGALYITELNSSQQAVLAPDGANGDAFGSAILVQSSRFIVSAPNDAQGSLYVVTRAPQNRPYILQTASTYDVRQGETTVSSLAANSVNSSTPTITLADSSAMFILQNNLLRFESAADLLDGNSYDVNITADDGFTTTVKPIHINVVP